MRKPAAPAARQSIGLRVKTDLKQRLELIAAENGRSLAAECELRLERSLKADPNTSPDLRTIIREEIEADRERQLWTDRGFHPLAADLATKYGRSLSYLNGEPKTDH